MKNDRRTIEGIATALNRAMPLYLQPFRLDTMTIEGEDRETLFASYEDLKNVEQKIGKGAVRALVDRARAAQSDKGLLWVVDINDR